MPKQISILVIILTNSTHKSCAHVYIQDILTYTCLYLRYFFGNTNVRYVN